MKKEKKLITKTSIAKAQRKKIRVMISRKPNQTCLVCGCQYYRKSTINNPFGYCRPYCRKQVQYDDGKIGYYLKDKLDEVEVLVKDHPGLTIPYLIRHTKLKEMTVRRYVMKLYLLGRITRIDEYNKHNTKVFRYYGLEEGEDVA
jgi:hypothetical protein